MLAIAMGWELGNGGSQAVIGRIRNLQLESPKGGIVEAATEGGKDCMGQRAQRSCG